MDILNAESCFFKQAVECAFNHVMITDADGVIVYANEAAEKMTGYTFEEMKGNTPRLWGKQMNGEFYRSFWNTIKVERKAFHGEVKNKRKNGEVYYAIATVSPIVENNDLKGFIGVEEDITRIKELERAKDEFLSIASHELRTPLAAIDGIVSMVVDGDYGEVSSEVKEALDDVNVASKRLIRLVGDLLSLSRIQMGRMKYELKEINMMSVMKEFDDFYKSVMNEKNLEFSATGMDVLVQVDEDKLREVLNNLLSNALKFTEKGSIFVFCEDDGEMVRVKVKDTGYGIAEVDKNRLFGKFTQLGDPRKHEKGTGLGLYLSREMVRKMGGELWLDWSERDKGTVFAFSLPKVGTTKSMSIRDIIGKEEGA